MTHEALDVLAEDDERFSAVAYPHDLPEEGAARHPFVAVVKPHPPAGDAERLAWESREADVERRHLVGGNLRDVARNHGCREVEAVRFSRLRVPLGGEDRFGSGNSQLEPEPDPSDASEKIDHPHHKPSAPFDRS